MRRLVGLGTCFEYELGDATRRDGPARASSRRTRRASSRPSVSSKRYVRRRWVSFAWARLFYLYGPFEDARTARSCRDARPARGSRRRRRRRGAAARLPPRRRRRAADLRGRVERPGRPVNIGSGAGGRRAAVVLELGAITGRPELVELGALAPLPTIRRWSSPTIGSSSSDRLGARLTLDQGLARPSHGGGNGGRR